MQQQPIALVSEKEYEYGAEAFEAYMEENKCTKKDVGMLEKQDKEKSR